LRGREKAECARERWYTEGVRSGEGQGGKERVRGGLENYHRQEKLMRYTEDTTGESRNPA